MEIKYTGTFEPTSKMRRQFKQIYNICRNSKIDVVNAFINNRDKIAIITADDKNTNLVMASEVSDLVASDDEIDNYKHVRIEESQINSKDEEIDLDDLEDILEDIMQEEIETIETDFGDIKTTKADFSYIETDKSEKLVVTLPIKALLALASYDDAILIVEENNIVVQGPMFKISFTKSLVKSEQESFIDIFRKVDWENINMDNFYSISSKLDRLEKDKFRQIIGIADGKIYTYNDNLICEAPTETTKKSYTLHYAITTAIKNLGKYNKISIAKNSDFIMLRVNNIYMGWGMNNETIMSNLMDLLEWNKKYKFIRIKKEDWNKLRILDNFDYNKVDVLTIDTTQNAILLSKNDNIILVQGSFKTGWKIKVDQRVFELAKLLSGVDQPTVSLLEQENEFFGIMEGESKILFRILNVDINGSETNDSSEDFEDFLNNINNPESKLIDERDIMLGIDDEFDKATGANLDGLNW